MSTQNLDAPQPRLPALVIKTAISHTITYFIMGVLAARFLNYAAVMARPGSDMRPITSPWVMAGPLFQPLRGVIFALVFYPLRECLFARRNGWLLMGWMLIGLGILCPFGAASGSIEGMIYTLEPIRLQLQGWLEVVPQALLLSAVLCYWVNHPGKRWLNWVLIIVFLIVMALPALGLLARKR